MLDYGPRYATVVKGLGFEAPTRIEQLEIHERLRGDASTDMGSLSGNAPTYDSQPLAAEEHARLVKILEACWRALDRAAEAGRGKALRKGARGGGRNRDAIVQHVLDGEGGYLRRLEYKRSRQAEMNAKLSREAMLEALAASVRGEVPELGPRGGKRWSGRYFVRREAWHVLDHAWEIEDRIERSPLFSPRQLGRYRTDMNDPCHLDLIRTSRRTAVGSGRGRTGQPAATRSGNRASVDEYVPAERRMAATRALRRAFELLVRAHVAR